MGKFYNIEKTAEGEQYSCNYCDFVTDRKGDMLRHHNPKAPSRCPQREWQKEGEAAPVEGIYKGDSVPNEVLYDVLKTHPDILERHIKEVMWWAEAYGSLHPTTVSWILGGLKGVSNTTANVIAQKYSLALMKAQREGRMGTQPTYPPLQVTPSPQQSMPIGPVTSGPQQFPFQMGQAGIIQQRPQAGQTPFLTREEFYQMQKDKEEKDRISKLEERIEKTSEDVADVLVTFKKDIFEKMEAKESAVVVEEMPVDKDGKPAPVDNYYTIKRVTRPVSAGREESFVDQLLKAQELGVFGTQEATPSLEKNPEFVSLKKDFESTQKTLESTNQELRATQDRLAEEKEKKAEERDRNLREELRNIRSEMNLNRQTNIEGVLLGIGTKLADKTPAKDAVRLFETPAATGQPTPETGIAGAEARGGILKELGKRGLVTTVRERIRGK